MKLSKQQIKLHEECESLLNKEVLTFEEKIFVYENWFPAYNNQIGKIASFFTPYGLTKDFQLHICGDRIIDLCAGIGVLSFGYFHHVKDWDNKIIEVVCIEQNPEFVKVGKKLFPEATWICTDAIDEKTYNDLGHFDYAVSNPPYGNIKHSSSAQWLLYKGSEFEYKIIEIASKISKRSAFIIPQQSCPFKYSGEIWGIKEHTSSKLEKFIKETKINLRMNIGVDCNYHKDDWKGASPTVEIACIDKYEDDINGVSIETEANNQTSLF